MVQKTTWPQAGPSGRASRVDSADRWPAELAGLLGDVRELLDQGRAAEALDRVGGTEHRSPWLANAAAVCRLRLGDAGAAVATLRGLVLASGGLILREDVPTVFAANFATALISDGNVLGGLRTLGEVRDADHPAIQEVRDAVRRWEASMTVWEKFRWTLGGSPPRPLVLDFPLGRL